MRWMFFVQNSSSHRTYTPGGRFSLLTNIGSLLDSFRSELNDPVQIEGHWLDEEAGVYELVIDDVLLGAEFDAFLEMNPEYDTWQECPEVARLA